MSTTRKVAHNTIIQLVGKVISTILGLVAIGMMTRYLGQEQFGWYVTTLAFLQFIAIMIDFGLIPVTAQMMSEPKFDKTKLFKNLVAFRFVTAVFFLALAPLIALFFPYPIEVKIAISFTTISMLAVAMNQVFLGLYQTRLKMYIQAIGEVVGRIVLVGGLFLLISRGSSFIPIMIVVMLGNVAYAAFMWISASRETNAGFAFDWPIWKAIAIKMWPIAIAIMCNVIYLKGDTLLLSIFRTQAEVGLYGAAYRVIDILAQVAMMVMGLMLPILAYTWTRGMKEQFQQRYQQAFDGMMLLGLPIAIGAAVVATDIMQLVAGDDFIASGGPLAILSLGIVGIFLGAVFGHTAVAINKQKQTLWIYGSNAVITIIGYLIVIPRFGMTGAAWMTVFSELYSGLLLWFVINRYVGTPLHIKTFAKIMFSTIVMASAIMLIPNAHVLIKVVVGALVYAAFAFGLGAVSKQTILEVIKLRAKSADV